MSLHLTITVSCDGYLNEGQSTCQATTETPFHISLTHGGTLKGFGDLPDGWISEVSMTNNVFHTKYLCPSCGKKRMPWRYK
jgi:hypothetical protein